MLRNPVIEGRTHVAPDKEVKYKTNPPTSGNHDPMPADDGVYSRPPTAKTIKHFVHTLEHGRIEIQYDPALDKRRIDQLGGLFNDDPYHMVLFPNRRMPYAGRGRPPGATCWAARRSRTRPSTRSAPSATATATRVPSRPRSRNRRLAGRVAV